jgi:hypothetical protein
MLHPKRKYSSSKSSSISSSKSSSKKDSLFNCCTPIERGFKEKKCRTKHTRQDTSAYTSPFIIDFLRIRNEIFGIKLPDTLNETYIDCINIGHNDILINNENIITDEKIIKIEKYLSNGCYGSIFIASVDGLNKYVIKFMDSHATNINEIKAMIKIKQTLKDDIPPIPNFIYMAYYYLNCNKITNTTTQINDIKSYVTTNYSLIVLEYFDNTLYNLLSSIYSSSMSIEDKIELYNSLFTQMILSIYIFHNKFNYIHNDAHLRNFLYKTVNKEDNYFYYIINEKTYFVKNCGYLVVLSDYGLVEEINETTTKKKIFKDYSVIISQLLNNIPNISNIDQIFYTNYIMNICKCSVAKGIIYDDIDEKYFLETILVKYLNIKNIIPGSLINNFPYICN